MKTLKYLLFLTLFALVACNGSTTQQVPYSDPTLVAKVDALTLALAAATHEDAQKFSSLKIIGQAHGVASAERTMAIGQAVSPNFGPCTDMGTLIGFVATDSAAASDPLSATYEAFKTCMGYTYEAQVGPGTIRSAPRIFFGTPNCDPNGPMYEWEAAGAAYNTQTLQGGVVFLSPVDDSTQLMVAAGQTPQSVQFQTVMLDADHVCQPDMETQLVYSVSAYQLQTTGVASKSVGSFTLASP